MEKYRPSNGTEAIDFMAAWCDQCIHDAAFRDDDGDSCPIVAASVAFLRNDPNYPVEWVKDADGPHCTAFDPVVPGGVIRDARQLELAA